ncbi:MAG TPA: replicative DNA helicase [Proteobacteria bacterium]|nr:replicative DNA helicase [bacterium BMS3Abin14]HDL53254.1 replicative DNA helicase [Pseudomonadota bacterium]
MSDHVDPRKVPPQNLEAERAVLGAILLDNQVIYSVMEALEPNAFYQEGHRTIFSSMLALNERGQPIDLVTLTNRLRSDGLLERAGGAGYIPSLAGGVPTSAGAAHYANIVKEKAILRDLITTSSEIVEECFDSPGDVDEIIDEAERRIFKISDRRIGAAFYSIREIVKSSFSTIEGLYARKEHVTGVPTGFKDIDDLTSGLQSSDLIIVAGRPSMGKTAFALNIAHNAACKSKLNVAIFSLEMAREQLVTRMLCSEARIDAHRLRSGYLGDTDWPKLTTAAGLLSEASIFIDDTPALSAMEMRAKSRRMKADKGLDLVIVDYMQLMRGRGRIDSREQEISEISRSLKSLAKELALPVVALSQLNRAVENRQDKRPMLADLRESGAIEQDADVIFFIYRDEFYNKGSADKGSAEIIIGKQRNGPVGTRKLAWLDKYTRFEDLTDRQTF